MPEPNRSTSMYTTDLADAIRGIYRVYGRNLAEFFRDVEEPVGHAPSRGRELRGHIEEARPRKRRVRTAQ